MTISTTCRKVIINNGVLSAECLKADQKTYAPSSISLDAYIGNVDGNFSWGGQNFSQSAQDVGVIDGVLYAKLKAPGGKYVDAKFDLNPYIINNEGAFTAIAAGATGVAKAQAPSLLKTLSAGSTASAASAASAFSASSTTSSLATSVSQTSTNAYKSNSYFKSSSFKSQSQHYLIEDTCSNYQLRDNCHFHLDYNHPDGRVSHTYLDLDQYICNENGQLQWGSGGFSQSCRSIVLDGCFLIAECLVRGHSGQKEHYVTCRFNLCERLRILDGILIFIEIERKLSVLLSEVPWMKFKVIAEPDLSVFGSHPIVQETLVKIAESTVEHVTIEMHRKLTIAMEEAIIAITASAMKHVRILMETTVTDVVGHASACASVTEAECLHIERGYYGRGGHRGGRHGGEGYGGGGYEGGHGGGGHGGGYGGGGHGGNYGGGGQEGGYGGGGYGGGNGGVYGGGGGGGYGGGGYGNGTYAGGENGENGTVHFGGPQGGVVFAGNGET